MDAINAVTHGLAVNLANSKRDPLMTISQRKLDLSWRHKQRIGTMKLELRDQQTSGKAKSDLWSNPATTRILWVVQAFLALFFLYGGAIKLVPPDSLPGAALMAVLLSPLPQWIVDFIGITEVLGAFGLILPVRLGILPILTPIAAVGLIIEMIGATIFVVLFYGIAPAAFSVVTGLLLAFVASGCWLRLKAASERM